MSRSLRPLLAAALLAAGLFATAPAPLAQDALPLTRGFYVPVDVPCAEASNATLALFTGQGFNSSQVGCDITNLVGDEGEYRFTEECAAIQSGETFTMDGHVAITDERHFTRIADYGSTAYHFCPQSELPEPWRDNDLSWLDEQP
jgi:hypothetical protein